MWCSLYALVDRSYDSCGTVSRELPLLWACWRNQWCNHGGVFLAVPAHRVDI